MMHPCVMPACLSATAYSSTSTGCSCATCVAGIALKPVPCMRWAYCCLQQSGTGLTLARWLQIDNDGELEGGIIKLKATEIVINSIKLRWKDKATGEVREEGKTKPEVVMRQLGSQPGQVGPTWAGGLAHGAATQVRVQQPTRSECSRWRGPDTCQIVCWMGNKTWQVHAGRCPVASMRQPGQRGCVHSGMRGLAPAREGGPSLCQSTAGW